MPSFRSQATVLPVIDVIPLRYGTAFKKAFSDPEVFSGFVGDVLGVDLHFTHIEQEKAFLPPIGNIDVRFDLFGEDPTHRAIVELQHVREDDAFDRFHYYHLVAQIEQVSSSKKYQVDHTVYTIVVLTRLPAERHLRFDMASQSSDLVTHDGRALGLFNHRIVFVNPRALSANTPPALRTWLELIEDSLDQRIDETAYANPLQKKVISAIERSHLTPNENYWFKEEAIWEDTKDGAFREGLKEGHDRGLKEGHDKGLKEGIDRGLKEGLYKAIVDMCDVLGISLDDSRHARLTALNVEDLEALRTQIKLTKDWPLGCK